MIVLVNYPFDPDIRDAAALLARYQTLSGWARALARQGGEPVTVVQRFWRDSSLHADGVDYRFVFDGARPLVPIWYLGKRMVTAVKDLHPTVVHVNGMVYPLSVRALRRRLPPTVPILVQDHGGIHDGSPGFRDWRWRTLHRFGLRKADGFLFAAHAQATPWARAGIISERQAIYTVCEASSDLVPPNRGDSTPISLAGAAPGRLPGMPALLWVGRLNANKDPLTVLAGVELAAKQAPHVELTMIFGTNDLLPEVQRRVASSPELAKRVHLKGYVDRSALPGIYASADLFVLGSHHEGGAYALMEALSLGVIPVVTDIPAFRALTGDGTVGAHFPVGDAQALARAIVDVGGTAVGIENQRAAVEQHFASTLSWTAIGRRALAIYGEAARKARHGIALQGSADSAVEL